MEDGGDAEALVFGREAERRQFALGAGDEDAVAHLRADGLGQVVAENDGGIRRVGLGLAGGRLRVRTGRFRFKIACRAGGDGVEDIADRAFLGGDNALDEREAGARAARDQHLAVDSRRCGGDVGNAAQPFYQRLPVANAVRLRRASGPHAPRLRAGGPASRASCRW